MKVVSHPIIRRFRGEYAFLSNFYDAPVTYQGMTFQNNEAAFQAQKCMDPEQKKCFMHCDAAAAKALGRRVKLRPDWDDIRLMVMHDLVFAKFTQNPELKAQLLATGMCDLEEGNDWGDRFWGTVDGNGENHLGRILMEVREQLYTLAGKQAQTVPEEVVIWRYDISTPFSFGRSKQPIKTTVRLADYEKVILHEDLAAIVVTDGPAKGVYELQSGGLVGRTVEEVKADIDSCDDFPFMMQQIMDAAKIRDTEAKLVSNEEFGLPETFRDKERRLQEFIKTLPVIIKCDCLYDRIELKEDASELSGYSFRAVGEEDGALVIHMQ